ncbi:SusC/RagA family TonB-linked outer membrane protein [Mucilaginibacter psychrotolerans]|nr:TonB-dependent receptor [Mucilaginibacter psychrotolerans]
MSLASFAQSRQISGTVTSADGVVPGASVSIKGTTTGVMTDINGAFKLSVTGNPTLLVSVIGYTTKEVAVGAANTYTIRLESNVSALNEVVVIGYGTSKRKDLNGAVSSVSAETIAKLPVPSLDLALQGRAPGVQVTANDGAPGGNTTILIRGVGSLASGGNNPLYVVDGYPLDGGINNFNTNDIATIDVLKDASATAIYGIRGANGVVIITTKKGRKDGVQLTVDAYNSFQAQPKKYDLLNAQQWATLANEIGDADANFVELANWRNPSSLTTADWQSALYRTGKTQSYSIAVRGGSDKVQTAASIGYYDQKGIVVGSYFKRVTLGLNSDYQATKWLKSSTSAKYTYQTSSNPYGTGALGNLTQLIPTLDGGNSATSQIKDANGNYGFYNPINTYTAKYNNPLYSIENNEYENIGNLLLTNSSLEATIIDGLKIKTNAGVRLNTYSGSYFQPEDTRIQQQYPGAVPTNALYSQRQNNTFEWLWENTLSYDKTFGQHAISFVGGVSEQSTTYVANGGSGIPKNSVIRDLAQLSNMQFDAEGNGKTITTLASQFGRLTYRFMDRYSINGTVRRDGSSKFDEGHKYGVFPVVGATWRAKEEPFLKNVNWLTDLKFRGSYGKVGNQGSIGSFQYQALYSTGLPAASSGNLGYPFNKLYQGGIAQSQPANDKLRWETDYQTDIGMDLGLLNGDLTLTVDLFKRDSKDFLLTLAAPAQSGYNYITRNVGSMENKGIEIGINYRHKVNEVQYGVALSFSAVKNRLTSLTSGTDNVTVFGGLAGGSTLAGPGWSDLTYTKTYIGQPVGSFYGYKTVGIFQTQAQINALNAAAAAKFPSNPYYYQSATSPGDRYFEDTNGDGHVTTDDQVSLGSPLPKFYGGLNLDLSYKAFDFNAYFYGVYGNKILNYQQSSLQSFQNRSFVGVENVSRQYYENRWTTTNPSNVYTRATYSDALILSNVPSSTWIENGSFLKLKNVTVGYSLPKSITDKVNVAKVRLYVSTQNLFTITSYTGLDPEIGIQGGNATQNGIDNGTFPGSKFYTVGLNVTFK